jgi:hypothetical protein
MAAKCAVRRVEVTQKQVKNAKGKMQTRHVVTAHFHPKKSTGGKGAKAAFMSDNYQKPQVTEHDTPESAQKDVNGLMNDMEPDDSGGMSSY